jgi:release factor glutamine methyltransferase
MARDGEAWRARTFSEAVGRVAERLSAAGVETARGDAWLLAAAATGRARASLMAGGPNLPSAAELARLDELARRRCAREPIAYILGEKEFWSLPFQVSPAALIPRPETETVVEAALAQVRDRRASLRILDLGTGCGCLFLALLSELPRATGLGVDLSPSALRLASVNAGRLKLAPRARFERRSWARGLDCVFDLIVSNPPYVGTADLARLAPEVRDFEPQLALVAGPDGLDAYRTLLPDCARLLAPGGALALEIGQGQGNAVAALLARHGFALVERRPDLAGIERCLVAQAAPA